MRGFLAAVILLVAAPAAAQTAPFALETVADGLSAPVYATAPAGDPRLFVVEQTGAVRILREGAVLPVPFLDVSGLVSCCGERGLLGLAFHPEYAENGRLFINFTDTAGNTRVVEFGRSDDPDIAGPEPVRDWLRVAQPYGNHNGGWIDFGPDGLLYVALGDGGAGGDPHGNGQNLSSPLGKILRIDVDAGGEPEIFASGVRNPWRNAFDGDRLYIADVGQGAWEEVNVVGVGDAGANLGWNVMEGASCFGGSGCDAGGFVHPIHVYSHDEGCSITGGFVYRGSAIPVLEGRYLFADYCSGELYSLRYDGETAADVVDYGDALGRIGAVTSFGRDAAGEIYVTIEDGRLLKIVPAS